MDKKRRRLISTEFRQNTAPHTGSPRRETGNRPGSRHPLEADLGWFVGIRWHDYASCYVWVDCPLYNPLGDIVGHRRGNTIYLDRAARHQRQDLLHELGHAVGRHFDIVGHRENHYIGSWERRAQRLIGAVSSGRHWSAYLNWHAARTRDFAFSAASEIWAELFMLHFLYPQLPEAGLIEREIESLRRDRSFRRLEPVLTQICNSRGGEFPDSPGIPRSAR